MVNIDDDPWDVLEKLMSLRAEFAINHAVKGFGMDYDDALELLRNYNDDLTQEDKDKRDRLVAAVDNLVDFAVAEEFQMYDELPNKKKFSEQKEGDEDYEEAIEDYDDIDEKYNSTYAAVENNDIEWCMTVAAFWITLSESTTLTYMTMGDERVRPWHLSLEGETYPKSDFPSWMIPPIEHQCRCFLIEDSGAEAKTKFDVKAKIKEMPSFVDPTFKESVAQCGRIFSDEHPYFQIPKEYNSRLKSIAGKIKSKYYAV